MNLNQTGNYSFTSRALPVDLLQKLKAVNRVDKVYERSDVLYLVCLQMADHMPLDIFWQRFVFRSKFLCPVLPKCPLAAGICLHYFLNGLSLANRNQSAGRWYHF